MCSLFMYIKMGRFGQKNKAPLDKGAHKPTLYIEQAWNKMTNPSNRNINPVFFRSLKKQIKLINSINTDMTVIVVPPCKKVFYMIILYTSQHKKSK